MDHSGSLWILELGNRPIQIRSCSSEHPPMYLPLDQKHECTGHVGRTDDVFGDRTVVGLMAVRNVLVRLDARSVRRLALSAAPFHGIVVPLLPFRQIDDQRWIALAPLLELVHQVFAIQVLGRFLRREKEWRW